MDFLTWSNGFQHSVQQACSKLWDSKTPIKAKLEKVYANSGYNVSATMDMVMDDSNLIISTAVDVKDRKAPHNSRTKLMVLGKISYFSIWHILNNSLSSEQVSVSM